MLAGDLQEHGQAGAHAQEDRVEAFQQFVHGLGAADDRVDLDLGPHGVPGNYIPGATMALGRRNSGMP